MLEGLYVQCYERIVSTEYHISSVVEVFKVSIIRGEDLKDLSMWRKFLCRASHIGHCLCGESSLRVWDVLLQKM